MPKPTGRGQFRVWMAFVATINLPHVPVFAEGRQKGIATYYTTKSCIKEGTSGVFTASGARYDETKLTIALPRRDFGKRYRVCNAKTGRCAVATHTDFGPGRGPRARGVIVDATPALFDALGGVRGCKAWGCWGELQVTVELVEGGDNE